MGDKYLESQVKIGKVTTPPPLLLAPIAGYTDKVFRSLCKEQGASLVYTEFVNSDGIVRGSEKTKEYLDFDYKERPVGIQIFGTDPNTMAEAARYIEQEYEPDIIDINFGCSVRKVIQKGAGAALLRDISLLAQISKSVAKSVSLPVTAKIRSGWSEDNINAVKVSKALENEGIRAITVHPRTAVTGFSSRANWEIIGEVKSVVNVPVIGNGGVKTIDDALRMFNKTGCDGIMIGRGALGNPWIFSQITNYFDGKNKATEVILPDKVSMCLRHLLLESEYRGAEIGSKIMKKHYIWYFREFPDASKIREKLVNAKSLKESIEILISLMRKIQQDEI
jgi:tRNA-dihydrouridine synthase B